jgi:hypothetical protein
MSTPGVAPSKRRKKPGLPLSSALPWVLCPEVVGSGPSRSSAVVPWKRATARRRASRSTDRRAPSFIGTAEWRSASKRVAPRGDDRRVIGTHRFNFRILRVSRQDTKEHGGQGWSRWTIMRKRSAEPSLARVVAWLLDRI